MRGQVLLGEDKEKGKVWRRVGDKRQKKGEIARVKIIIKRREQVIERPLMQLINICRGRGVVEKLLLLL